MAAQTKTPTLEIVINPSTFEELYKGSAYTITGVAGPLEKWVKGYTELLQKEDIGTPEKFYTFKGKQMNEKYGLTGNNRYSDDLTFLSFLIDSLETAKLAMFKLRMQDRWFDDIVDNNAMRERFKEGES